MKIKNSLLMILISVFGVISIILPVLFQPDIPHYEAPLFPLIRTGIEESSLWTVGFLFLLGIIGSLLVNLQGWKIGLLTVSLLPLVAIAEMGIDSSSHNLFPIEFFFYAVFSIPSMIGAYILQGIESFDPNKRKK